LSALSPRIRHLVDGALLVEYPEAADEEASRAAVGLGAFLREKAPEGLDDAVPGARTLFCAFEPRHLSHDALSRRIAAAPPAAARASETREHRISVVYGGDSGPDLTALARRAGLSVEEAERRHASALYRVAFLGFAPGFAYLTGLPSELTAPRLATPRPRVSGGSLAVAGFYSGVYPADGPGGWNLIGRAAARLFDPAAQPPSLLLPGDRVRFEPQTPEGFAKSLAALPPVRGAPSPAGIPLFRLATPGLWSAVCGAPFSGRGTFGLPPSGAMDLESLAAGNALAGNPPGAEALEFAVAGPELEALADATLVLSGAPCDAALDGRAFAGGAPLRISRGSKLVLGPVRSGVYSYLCVAGGLAAAGRLALPTRLAAGDQILRALGEAGPAAPLAAAPAPGRKVPSSEDRVVRILLGPQEFIEEGVAALLGRAYRVSSTSDRRGIRLEGPRLASRDGVEIPPEGTALGAIQVPADGQPIVLGPDRPVTGGYAKIATVVGADFSLVAQARPGTTLRFRAVSLAEALEARGRMTGR
jgi:KipI family sensor histidine kinase inhibitor